MNLRHGLFHHGRWLFDFKLSCGQGCDEGSFAHGHGFDCAKVVQVDAANDLKSKGRRQNEE
jgi:hypothetical protein